MTRKRELEAILRALGLAQTAISNCTEWGRGHYDQFFRVGWDEFLVSKRRTGRHFEYVYDDLGDLKKEFFYFEDLIEFLRKTYNGSTTCSNP